MPLVSPLNIDHDAKVKALADFFQTTLGFPPNSVLTMQRRPHIAKAFIEFRIRWTTQFPQNLSCFGMMVKL